MARLRYRGVLALTACVVCGLSGVPAAEATFHEIKVREISFGTAAASRQDAYVELQAYASGQNLLGGHELTTYSATGTPQNCPSFGGPVGNPASQMTVLIGGSASPGSPDLTCSLNFSLTGGAVCWSLDGIPTVDCVSWGSFSGSLPSSAGTPFTPPPDGTAMRRSIAAGNPNLLQDVDDTNNSAADFEPCPMNPRNNAAPIVETPCPGARTGGGGSAGRPNTKIKKRPKNKSGDDSPTFKFKSTESHSKFKCKLDHKPFKKCKSPKTYHGLDSGKHVFKVKAIDSDGNADKTPAKDTFKVLP